MADGAARGAPRRGRGSRFPGCAAHRRAGRSPRRLSLLLFCLLAGSSVLNAAPGDRPGVFLEGASVARAKALAVGAARGKGWFVAETGKTHCVFEASLDEPAAQGPPNAIAPPNTLLRIRADFILQPAGVNAYLYAEEIWWPGSSREWVGEITGEYREHLANALTSLQRQWDHLRHRGAVGPAPREADEDVLPRVRVEPSLGEQWPVAEQPGIESVTGGEESEPALGLWAYYAEAFAQEQGCSIGDLGAVLIHADGAGETHLVDCEDGRRLSVFCDRQACRLAP